jgi:hypothetical protein
MYCNVQGCANNGANGGGGSSLRLLSVDASNHLVLAIDEF